MLVQASKNRLFNIQNNWILIDSQRDANRVLETSMIALETFEIYLNKSYVLPESNVYLLIETDDNYAWEIWEGFKVSKMEKIQVHRHGIMTSDSIELNNNDSILLKSNLRGITLKATTVVSGGFIKKKSTIIYMFA